jgi:diacylglycerol kinase (ATP)
MTKTSAAPIVVVNPTASRLADVRGRAGIVKSVVDAVVVRTGRAPTVVDTTLEAARKALASARSAPLVVVVGGDGTLRETASILGGSGVPLAIVPTGTGNVFAAALGIPRRTSAAIALITSGRPEPVDLGRAAWGPTTSQITTTNGDRTTHVFTVACGLGLDARVMAGASADLKRRLGFGAYVLAMAREAARLRPATYRIEVHDDVHQVRGLVVLIANCGQIVPWLIGPRRRIDPTDGLLDVFVVTADGLPSGVSSAAGMLLSAAEPPQRRARSLRLRAARVRVTAEPREPIQVDGDPHEADWLEAQLEPGAIQVLRP